jgi:hypothetical protein
LLQIVNDVEDRFSQVDNVRLYEDKVETDGAFVSVYIRYDSRFLFYSRQVYSFMDLLGDVGGLQQALTLIGGFILT